LPRRPQGRQQWRRRGAVGGDWTAAAVALGVVVYVLLVAWQVDVQLGAPIGHRLVDLAVYRDGGRSILSGRHLYGYLTPPPQRLSFTYPPVAAVLAVPLAWLPFGAAGAVWTVAELACTPYLVVVGFRRLLPRFGGWSPVAVAVLAGVAQQMLPFRDELRFGQVDEFLVVLCVVDCLSRRGRWPRGALVGLAAAVKLTPLVFLPYLWLTGRRRAALTAAGTFVVLQLIAVAVSPRDASDYWTGALFHTSRLQPNNGTSNQSLRGMVLRSSLGHDAELAVLAGLLVVVALVGYRRAVLASMRGDEVMGIGLVGLLAVLLSPVAWIHHLVWLPLVLGPLVDRAVSPRRVGVAVVAALFYVARVPWIGRHLLLTSSLPHGVSRLVEDGFGLAAGLLLLALPRRRIDEGSPGPAVDSTPVLRA
jgi:alpha-1,2-mannosyltransferase